MSTPKSAAAPRTVAAWTDPMGVALVNPSALPSSGLPAWCELWQSAAGNPGYYSTTPYTTGGTHPLTLAWNAGPPCYANGTFPDSRLGSRTTANNSQFFTITNGLPIPGIYNLWMGFFSGYAPSAAFTYTVTDGIGVVLVNVTSTTSGSVWVVDAQGQPQAPATWAAVEPGGGVHVSFPTMDTSNPMGGPVLRFNFNIASGNTPISYFAVQYLMPNLNWPVPPVGRKGRLTLRTSAMTS